MDNPEEKIETSTQATEQEAPKAPDPDAPSQDKEAPTTEERPTEEPKPASYFDKVAPDCLPPFDRQARILNWKQDLVEKQVCLVLGVGGLGTSVAMGLCRLGVKKIILIDSDVVEIHNLNRQILFGHQHVGKSKVDSAKEELERVHVVGNTEIETHMIDVLPHWQTVVNLAKESTVVFNMIDVGDVWDLAIGALTMQLQLPLIIGGTFCQMFTVDFFAPPNHEQGCFGCSADTYDKETVEKLLPSKILEVKDLEWIPKNDNPVGESNVYLCVMCAEMMVAKFGTHLVADPDVKLHPRSIMLVNALELDNYDVAKEEKCLFCKDIESVIGPAPRKPEPEPEEPKTRTKATQWLGPESKNEDEVENIPEPKPEPKKKEGEEPKEGEGDGEKGEAPKADEVKAQEDQIQEEQVDGGSKA